MIVIETNLRNMPKSCTKCKYSYLHERIRFCGVAFNNGYNKCCPYVYNAEKRNWEYVKPEWCPLRTLEAETNVVFTLGGK